MPHTLEIIDGELYASGDNALGQLGLGHRNTILKKSLVLTNTDKDNIPWINCATGRFHSVALKKDLSLWVWGDNRFGQLARSVDIPFSTVPLFIDISPLIQDREKKIQIVTGDLFTIFYQYFEKAYGFGEFENIDTDYVSQYRTIVELTPTAASNQWVSVLTGPKTIIALSTSVGYKYTDWSGKLFSPTYTKFHSLKIGDIFTLYDPDNRDRVLYKKVNRFSKGRGCCSFNALCLHRMYRELISNVPPNIVIQNTEISVYDMLDPASREKYAKPILTSREKYGTDFIFNSALARTDFGLPYNTGIDIWTYNALFSLTNSINMLDFILYDALDFSDDLSSNLNQDTLVEKISAREVTQPVAGFQLPPYLLKRSNCILGRSSYVYGNERPVKSFKDNYFDTAYGMDKRKMVTTVINYTMADGEYQKRSFPYLYKINPKTGSPLVYTFTSRYGFGYPIYKSKENSVTGGIRNEPVKAGQITKFEVRCGPERGYAVAPDICGYDNSKIFYDPDKLYGVPGCPYTGKPKYIRDLEKDDSIYDHKLDTHVVDLPIDESGQIMSIKHILQTPYLIKLAMGSKESAFKQAFLDTTKRITTKYDGNINNIISDPGSDPMMFYTQVPDYDSWDGLTVSIPQKTVFYIGWGVSSLINILLDKNTSAREVNDYFGISQVKLKELWNNIITAQYPYNETQKYSFATLSGLFYNKLKDQPIFDKYGREIDKTGISTYSDEQFFDFPILAKTCHIPKDRPPLCVIEEIPITLPYSGMWFFTDRYDRSKLLIFGNYIDSFKEGATTISYQTWSGDENKTKNGNPVLIHNPSDNRDYVAKDAYQQHETSVYVLSATFDASEYMTIVQLKAPFLNNYLLGNLKFTDGLDLNYLAMPFIDFNAIISLSEKLASVPAPLEYS